MNLILLKKFPMVGGTILLLLLFLAMLAPYISPHDPVEQRLADTLIPPFWENGGSDKHLLGTDNLGRDILSRLLFGSRVSLIVGFSAVLISCLIGVWIGLMSGFFGGWVDSMVMRLTDVQLSMPYILVAIAVIGALGPSTLNLIIVLSACNWASYARAIRGEVLSVKENEFVELAIVGGCRTGRILFLHILPNVVNTVIILTTLDFGRMIIFEAALSFLGLGVQPPAPSWGNMLADGRAYLTVSWGLATFPGLAILLTVLAMNLFGDWLRDILDPKRMKYMAGDQFSIW
jgi:peptide/nickel transport system permease protein